MQFELSNNFRYNNCTTLNLCSQFYITQLSSYTSVSRLRTDFQLTHAQYWNILHPNVITYLKHSSLQSLNSATMWGNLNLSFNFKLFLIIRFPFSYFDPFVFLKVLLYMSFSSIRFNDIPYYRLTSWSKTLARTPRYCVLRMQDKEGRERDRDTTVVLPYLLKLLQ